MILLLKLLSFTRLSRLGISKSGTRLLLVLCSVCGFAFSSHSQIVLLDSGYDVLSLNNLTVTGFALNGRFAALNKLSYINGQITNSPDDSLPVLYAGKKLTVNNVGTIAQGDILYGTNLVLKNTYFEAGYNSYKVSSAHQAPFSTSTTPQHFQNISQSIGNLQQTGTSNYQSWGRLDLSGNQGINVFNVNLSDYGNLSQIGISAPYGTTVIVNVYGQNFQGIAPYLSGVDSSHVLFNFVDATSVQLGNGQFNGTYLAPNATISLSTTLTGQLIGEDIQITGGSFTSSPFSGSLPTAIPEPSFYAGLMGIATLIAFAYKRPKSALKTAA